MVLANHSEADQSGAFAQGPFIPPDSERNLMLYIFPKQRTNVGSIPD